MISYRQRRLLITFVILLFIASLNAICIYDNNNELNPIFDNDMLLKQIENIPNQYKYFTIPITVLEDNGMAITDKGLEINHTDVECNLEVNGDAIKLQIYK